LLFFGGEVSPNFRYHKIDWKKRLGQDAKIHHKIEDEMRVALRTTFNVCSSEAVFLDENENLDGWFNGGNWEMLGT